MRKRFMSIALALILVLGMLPTAVVAVERDGIIGGVENTAAETSALGAGKVTGARLNQSIEAVKNITVTATAGEAKDNIIPVTITLPEGTKLPKHKNANGAEGYWVGFALTAPEGAEKVKYAFGTTAESVANLTETALEENVTADGGKGIAFYANMDEENPKVYASVQWIPAADSQDYKESAIYTYQMDLSKVILDKPEEPGDSYPVGVEVSDFTNLLGKNASDLMENVTIKAGQNNTYTLSGTVKIVTGWKEFNSAAEEEQSGHYVALKLTKPATVTENFTVTLNGSKEKVLNKFFTEGEGTYETVIMRLDALRAGEAPKNQFTVAFNWAEDNTDTYTFDISNLVFEVPEVAVKPDVEGEKASATVEKDAIQDAVDSIIANKDLDVQDPVIDLSATTTAGTATAAAITLPNDTVSALAEAATANEKVTVAIATDVGAVTINKSVIEKLSTAAAGDSDSVVLNVEKAADATPEEAVENSEVYNVTFTKGDDEIAIEADSSAEIKLKLVFTVADTDDLTIGWTSGDKTGTVADVQFSEVVGGKTTATFTVDHLTSFYLVKADAPVEPAEGITLKYTHYNDAGFTEEDGKKYYGGKLEITNNTGAEKTYLVAFDNGGQLSNSKTLRLAQVVTLADGATATLGCQNTLIVTVWEIPADSDINSGELDLSKVIVSDGNGKGVAVNTLKTEQTFPANK